MAENKPIMIDGVDVSGCEYLDNINFNELCLMLSSPYECQVNCSDKPNCLFKQLARKTQECEELKKSNDEKNELLAKLGCPTTATAKMKAHCLQEQLDQLKAENKQLKKQIESDKGLITSAGKQNYQLIQEYDQLKAENEELKKKCNIYTCGICGNKGDCNKLYKTLTEIKEIARKTLNMVDYKTYFKRDNKSLKQEGFKTLYEILQIIDEVE